mmetsp:Transcript_44252/g.114985  ORF Transcript_44252/g.114985 Transcript_44252/m.114985 type:complete len:235 (-) Transcript_44252:30-734(-)
MVVNIVFMLAGIGMIAAGAVVRVALVSNTTASQCSVNQGLGPIDTIKACYNYLCSLLSTGEYSSVCETLSSFPIGIIVLGAFVFLLAVFGCCGAMKKNSCLLIIYFILVLIILVAQLAVGIAAIAFTGSFRQAISYVWNQATVAQKQTIQDAFDCCGVTGETTGCTGTKDTCDVAVETLIKSNIVIFAGVAIGVVVLEIGGLIGSCCVKAGAKSDKEKKDQQESAHQAAYTTSV